MNDMKIPVVALVLGGAGLIPFVWGVMALRFGVLPLPGVAPREAVLAYGLMIFCFMAGTHWGFAAKGNWAAGYALSVLPVLGFLAVMFGGAAVTPALIAGFAVLLPLDALFARRGLAPGWWLRLRLGLSVVVIACLVAIWQMG
jgi:hypothetical protein